MKRTFLISTVAAAAVVAVVSFTAFAHGPKNGGMMGGNGHMGMGQYTQVKPATFDELKSKLNLTQAQLPAWEAYVNTAKDVQESFEALHESMDPKVMHEMSDEDRQSFMQGVWDSRNEDAKALQAAQNKLLTVLDTEQKTTINNTQTYAAMPCNNGMQSHMTTGMMGSGMMSPQR